jgi:formate dehydrogenase (NADP+) beta subunit
VVRRGGRQKSRTLETVVTIPCDAVILAIGQDNAFPWIERDIGIEFGEWDMPVVDRTTFQSTLPGVFFGGDAAWGPENIIWAVEHGHQAAISIHNYCHGVSVTDRPAQGMNLLSEKMGLHQWSYSNATARRRA